MKNIAVRLWNNQMFGTTYGKGLRRSALFNGTIEIAIPPIKYLVDLEPIESWYHHTKSFVHLKMLENFTNKPKNEPDALMSWITRYENAVKTPVEGYCAFDLSSSVLVVHINDQEYKLNESWELQVKECLNRTPGKPTPNFIATNYELKLVA